MKCGHAENIVADICRADACQHHALYVLDINSVFGGEFAECAVNRRHRIGRLDCHRFQQSTFVVGYIKADDLGRTAAYIYAYYGFHVDVLAVVQNSIPLYFTTDRLLCQCVLCKNGLRLKNAG